MFDLACLNQIFYRAGHLFDGHIWIRAVLVKEVNSVCPKPLERCLGNSLDLLRSAIQANPGSRPLVAIVWVIN